MLLAFVYGLLVSVSPCTFPLIPIIYRVIGGWKGTLLYLLGSAISYVILGIAIISVGIYFQNFMHWWPIKLAFSLLLGYLALSAVDILKLPKITAVATKNPLLLGILAPIICSPCMTPALAVILSTLKVAKAQGIAQLLLFGLGVNIPFIAMCFGLKWVLDHIKRGNIGRYITYLNSLLLVGVIVYIWL
jgi:cytochrome c biogenesis protein CcdA